MATQDRPKSIVVRGVTYVLEPKLFRYKTKTGAVVNVGMYDMVLSKEAEQWIRAQLAKKRRVYRDEAEKLEYALFSTDIPEFEKLKIILLQRFPMFKGRPIKLRALRVPEELNGPLTDDQIAASERESEE